MLPMALYLTIGIMVWGVLYWCDPLAITLFVAVILAFGPRYWAEIMSKNKNINEAKASAR